MGYLRGGRGWRGGRGREGMKEGRRGGLRKVGYDLNLRFAKFTDD
jgi:hypothetical protein